MKPLFLQTHSTNPHFEGMVLDHKERHQAYCDKWAYEYLIDGSLLDLDHPLTWQDQIKVVAKHLCSGKWSHVFWIDADTFVADFTRDMRETTPGWCFLACTLHPHSWTELQPVVGVNAGITYWRTSDMATRFITRLLDRYGNLRDNQIGMNLMLFGDPEESRFWQQGYRMLNNEWNNNMHDQPSPHPIVCAFHGCLEPNERRILMQNIAKKYPVPEEM